jgi:hypothetical protein
MTLQSLYVGISLVGLIGSAAIAPTFEDSAEAASIKTIEAVELFFTCEDKPSFVIPTAMPCSLFSMEKHSLTLSVITRGVADGTSKKTLAISATLVLSPPSSHLIVLFDNVQLRCGIGPDINWGRIVIGHIN